VSQGRRTLNSVSIALRTGTPSSDERISTIAASWEAPIQTNSAMKTSSGLKSRPTKPNTRATPCPRVAAMRVART
jgi:hypothetical protein